MLIPVTFHIYFLLITLYPNSLIETNIPKAHRERNTKGEIIKFRNKNISLADVLSKMLLICNAIKALKNIIIGMNFTEISLPHFSQKIVLRVNFLGLCLQSSFTLVLPNLYHS